MRFHQIPIALLFGRPDRSYHNSRTFTPLTSDEDRINLGRESTPSWRDCSQVFLTSAHPEPPISNADTAHSLVKVTTAPRCVPIMPSGFC